MQLAYVLFSFACQADQKKELNFIHKPTAFCMYESSSLTIFHKYIFAPLWFGVIVAAFFIPRDNPGQRPGDDIAPLLVVFTPVMIYLIILAVRLKRVTANRSHLTIISVHGDKKIDYKNIEYVSEAALINPRLITLKYHEPETGESDIILIMPSTTSEMFRFKFLQEHDMTQYIREQIFIHNPKYSTESEPSRWRTLGLVSVTMVAATLLAQAVSVWLT
jgi:hypothetical protein